MSIKARLVKLEQAKSGTEPTEVRIFIGDIEEGKYWEYGTDNYISQKELDALDGKRITVTGEEYY